MLPDSELDAVADWLPGERVRALGFGDRYQQEKSLGAGGMGEVTLCLDRQIGRRVALKRLHAEDRDDPHHLLWEMDPPLGREARPYPRKDPPRGEGRMGRQRGDRSRFGRDRAMAALLPLL